MSKIFWPLHRCVRVTGIIKSLVHNNSVIHVRLITKEVKNDSLEDITAPRNSHLSHWQVTSKKSCLYFENVDKNQVYRKNADDAHNICKPTTDFGISADQRENVLQETSSTMHEHTNTPVLNTFSAKADLPKNTDDDVQKDVSVMKAKPVTKLKPSYNLAAYVNQSVTLIQLLKLGVDLAAVEAIEGAADLIVKLDFKDDIEPYLIFLHKIGIPDGELGSYLTKNPLIFRESCEDLQIRINYLKSKKFNPKTIARIVLKAPRFLLMETKLVDEKLGYYQQEFKLNGKEVRAVVTKMPKLITWDMAKIKDIQFQMKEFIGFSNVEIKEMFLEKPSVFFSNKYQLLERFDYLYNTMGLSHSQLVQWPSIFRTRLLRMKCRHEFLQYVGRAQYDATRENYVSLKGFVSGEDKDFCLNIAKCSVSQYNTFLKTL